MTAIKATVGFLFLLMAAAISKHYLRGIFEIGYPDILAALIPVLIWLALRGRIRELSIGDVRIVTAIKEVSSSPVEPFVVDLSGLPIETIETAAKAGPEAIPDIVEGRAEALTLELGYEGYRASVLQEYLNHLAGYPFFRYLVLVCEDQRLYGMADAREVSAIMAGPTPASGLSARRFVEWLEWSDCERLRMALPGFISAEEALSPETDKREALIRMNRLDVDMLPVVDKAGRLQGIVKLSRLTASMLVDLLNRLGPAPDAK